MATSYFWTDEEPTGNVQALSSMKSYWDNRNEIAAYNGDIYKGHYMIILHSMKPEVLHRILLGTVNYETETKMSHLGQV